MVDEQDRPNAKDGKDTDAEKVNDSEAVTDSEKKTDLIKSPDPEDSPSGASAAAESEQTADKTESQGSKRPGALWVAIGAAGILLVAALVAAAFFFVKYNDQKETNEAGQQASQALCAFSPTLVKIDWQNIDAYFEGVLEGSTGEFKTEFEGAAQQLKDTLVQGQVKSEQQDSQCGIQSADKDHAEILLTLGQSVTTITIQDAQVRQLAMVASMDKVDDRWLVSKLDAPWLRAQ